MGPVDDAQDEVGDRARFVRAGLAAVWWASVTFAGLRFVAERVTGVPGPWWVNVLGALAIGAVYLWVRPDVVRRSSVAVHATATIATISVLIPVTYGMTSSKWWLTLVGYSALLMGRRSEAIVWSGITLVALPVVAWIEPSIVRANTVAESSVERAASALGFVLVLGGVTAAFREIARQRARQLSDTARSLERAAQVRSRFLAHMSHELRTPLHAMIAMTESARSGDASKGVHESIDAAQQAAHGLMGLLNNILDVTRAEADAIDLDRRPFSLHATVSEILRSAALEARRRGLSFHARAEPGVVERRLGDRGRVAQLGFNLVTNALKFTETGGIAVRLSAVPGEPSRVRLEVADTGRGIPSEKIDAIFEPFSQVDATDAKVRGGAGLGLAISRELCRLMKGSLQVTSAAGKGSTFVAELWIPPVRGETLAGPEDLLSATIDPPTPREARSERPGLRILLCEDEPISRQATSELLTRRGHRVQTVQDGTAADERLRSESFDVLLTDVEMPGFDGFELTRRCRSRELATGATRLTIIATTAHAADADAQRLESAGVDAHLPKPFTIATLEETMQRTFERNAAQVSNQA